MTTPTKPGESKVLDLTGLSNQDLSPQETSQLQTAIDKDRMGRDAAFASEPAGETHLQPRALLSSGHSIPLVGLGTWKAAKGEVRDAVQHAIKAGYRHIDCAAVYGNEHEVGEGLTAMFQQGVVRREDIFITSKLWNTHHAPESVPVALAKTLSDLQLDYLDLYLIHWPSSLPGPTIRPPVIDTWRAMEALVDKGLVRSIGVSNFSIVKVQDLLTQARITPAVVQVEAHPYWRNDQLLTWLQGHGIHMTAYSPLGSPDSASMMGRAEDTPTPMKDPVVLRVAQELGKSPAQVLIRWAVQRGTSVLPKSVNPDRIAANLDVASWSIPEDKMAQLNSIRTQIRMVAGTFLVNPAGPYKTIEELWDEPSPPAVGPAPVDKL